VLLVVGAIVAGALAGLALGGSLRSLAEIRLRWWPLAVIGLAFQLVPVPSLAGQTDHWLGVGLLIASYVALLGFVAMNIRLPGFLLISVGFALNVLVISLNGGMPVSRQALQEAYGPGSFNTVVTDLEASGGAKHHLGRSDDVLVPLSDVIALGSPVHLVMSVGDVFFFLGVTWVIAAATRGPRGRHASAREPAGRHRPGATRERLGGRESPAPRDPEPEHPSAVGGPPPLSAEDRRAAPS